MATFDDVVVRLFLDATGLAQGQKDAVASTEKSAADLAASATKGEKAQVDAHKRTTSSVEKMAGAIVASNKKAAESFERVLRVGLTLLSVFAGAKSVEEFTRKVVSLDAALGRLGHNIGQTPDTLSSIGQAAQRMGGSFDGAVNGMKGLSDAFQDLRTTGTNGIMEPLARLQALSGKPITFGKDVHQNFLSIAEAMKAVDAKDPALADRLGRQILGGDESLVNLAKLGRTGVLEQEKDSRRHGVIDPKDAAAAQKLQSSFESLTQSVTDFGRKIVTAVAPALSDLVTWLDDIIDRNKGWIATRIGEYIQTFVDYVKSHKSDIEDFGRAIVALATAFTDVVAAVSGQSPLAVAFEAFGALLALRILAPLTSILSTMRLIGGLPLTGALSLLTGVGGIAAAAVVASTSPLNAGEPTVAPDGRLTYPDGHSEAGRVWDGHGAHGAQVRDRAHHDQVDNRNLWQRNAPKWAGGKDAPAGDAPVPTDAHTPLKDLISKHETGTTGAGGYETVYGHAERGGPLAPPKPITDMSIAEVLAYQREMKPKAGSPAFPVGRAQWVEKTLRGLTAKMDQNTKFTPEVQEKLFDRSIRPRLGQGPAGMRAEWDSMRSVSDGEIQSAIDGHRKAVAFMKDAPNSEAQQAGPKGTDAPRAPQSATGQKGVYPEWMDERSRREMAGVNAPLARDLLAASEATGQRFKVAQGMRTPEEAAGNAASGRGVKNSQHLYGAAADIHLLDDKGNVTYDRAAYQKFADAYEDHSRKSGGNSRWLGNAGGRWASDIVHFDQGLGYGQSRARDPYGEGGPTKADVTASRQDAYKSPDNPFARAARAINPVSPAEAKESPYHPPIQDDRSTRARSAAPPVDVTRVAPVAPPVPRETMAQTPVPIPAPKPVLVPSAVTVTKPSPFPGDAGQDYRARGGPQYGVPHVESAGDVRRPEVTSTLGGTRMLPAGRMLTLDDAANHVLKTMKGTNDNRPIKVDLTDGSATKIGVAGKSGIDMLMARHSGALRSHVGAELKKSGAEMDRAFGKAWTGLGHHAGIGAGERAWQAVNHAHHQTTTHVDRSASSQTHIGAINVHTAATDAKGIAADIEPHLARGQAAGRGNYGLA